MKAKDYVEIWNTTPGDEVDKGEALSTALVKDIKALVVERRTTSNVAMISIFREVNTRVKAACRLNPAILDNLLSITVKCWWPNVYPYLVKEGILENIPSSTDCSN